jgi:membrane protein insertase Oxa1/YidC/SpoIIIJ
LIVVTKKSKVNELFILQILTLLTLLFFVTTINLLSLWYLAGLYLIFLGIWLFLDDCDIFVGFLWVIDLGVGLIFFIFILHYSTFLHHKTTLNKSSRELTTLSLYITLLAFLYFFLSMPVGLGFAEGFQKT